MAAKRPNRQPKSLNHSPPPVTAASQDYPEREGTLRLRNFLLRSLEKAEANDTVRIPEARVLVALAELSRILGGDPLPQVRLARILGVAEPSLTAVVRKLKRNALIRETESELEPDQRPNRLVITEEGRRALAEFEDRYLAFPESALIDAREVSAFDDVLRSVEAAVSKMLEERLRILSSENYHDAVSFIEQKIVRESKKIAKDEKSLLLREAYQGLADAQSRGVNGREALTEVKRRILEKWPKPPKS